MVVSDPLVTVYGLPQNLTGQQHACRAAAQDAPTAPSSHDRLNHPFQLQVPWALQFLCKPALHANVPWPER